MSVFDEAEIQWGQAGIPGTGLTAGEKTTINSRLTALEGVVVPDTTTDLTDWSDTAPATGQLARWNGSQWEPYTLPAKMVKTNLNYIIDGGGAVIPTGAKPPVRANFSGTITGWSLLADLVGDVSIEVWRRNISAGYPPTSGDLIFTCTLTGDDYATDVVDIDLADGDILRFNVVSATTITAVTASLVISREV